MRVGAAVWRACLGPVALLMLHGTEARAQFLSVSGSPSLRVSTVFFVGAAPTPAVNASSTYLIYVPSGLMKIAAQLNTAMPKGLTLTATLTPKSGSSQGAVTLDTSPQDLVLGIGSGFSSGNTITYQLAATAAAGVVASQTRTITFTLVASP